MSLALACNTDTTPNQPHRNPNTHRTKNNTTNVVIQQNSRKLLMMDILMSETCWARKMWNKIASNIKLVFYSSTITMMYGPINISFFLFSQSDVFYLPTVSAEGYCCSWSHSVTHTHTHTHTLGKNPLDGDRSVVEAITQFAVVTHLTHSTRQPAACAMTLQYESWCHQYSN